MKKERARKGKKNVKGGGKKIRRFWLKEASKFDQRQFEKENAVPGGAAKKNGQGWRKKKNFSVTSDTKKKKGGLRLKGTIESARENIRTGKKRDSRKKEKPVRSPESM